MENRVLNERLLIQNNLPRLDIIKTLQFMHLPFEFGFYHCLKTEVSVLIWNRIFQPILLQHELKANIRSMIVIYKIVMQKIFAEVVIQKF